MTLVSLSTSIYLLELDHFKIILQKEPALATPSKYHLELLGSVISSVNYKSDKLGLGLEQIAAEYFVRICCGHKLTDGNKRMAVASLGYFLDLNKYHCSLSNTDLRNLAIVMAHQATSNVSIAHKIGFLTEQLLQSCTKN